MPRDSRVSALADLDAHLNELEQEQRRRRLMPRHGHDFASNDYLGLAGSAELKIAVIEALSQGLPIGSGGSRLLRGNHAEHEMLEEEAASFFGSESALFFSSGYAANSALLSTLPQCGDLIVYDDLIHASSREGMRLSRAKAQAALHNNVQSFADEIRKWREGGGVGRPWIVVESLYSMEGDIAPLTELMVLADRHDALLVVDEAHATGVFGHEGRGLAEALQGRENVITIRTCGKALGCEGALVCGARTATDFLINRGRGFIFSTAPSPLMAAAVRASLLFLQKEPERLQRLHRLVSFAKILLGPLGAQIHGTQILPLVIGDPAETMTLAARLQESGFDVRGIRPPTVLEGTSRLRISITLNVNETHISDLACAIASGPR